MPSSAGRGADQGADAEAEEEKLREQDRDGGVECETLGEDC